MIIERGLAGIDACSLEHSGYSLLNAIFSGLPDSNVFVWTQKAAERLFFSEEKNQKTFTFVGGVTGAGDGLKGGI